MGLRDRIDDVRDAVRGSSFDPELVKGRVIDTGPQSERAIAIANRLNAARSGRPKQAVVLWTSDYSAVTCRGRYVYVAKGLAECLRDDSLAFILAHEMGHHDLDHLTVHMSMAGVLGNRPRMEMAADRYAFFLCTKAGFDPRGGLTTMEPDLWEDEPEDSLDGWPAALRRLVRRYRQTHPPMIERYKALEELIRASQ